MAKKKILIIAMGNSMHTLRWINSIVKLDCDISCFSSFMIPFVSSDVKYSPIIKLYNFMPEGKKFLYAAIKNPRIFLNALKTFNPNVMKNALRPYVRKAEVALLVKLINKNNFDIIHTLHTQTSAQELEEAINIIGKKDFKWVHTVWGSDLYLHQWIPESKKMLENILPNIDFYWGEGRRDYQLARQLGFKGEFLKPVPAFGGMDTTLINKLNRIEPSKRKTILVKGYQNVVGRADIAFHALEKCVEHLKGYEIIIFSYENDIVPAIGKIFSNKFGIPVKCVKGVPYQKILELHLRSRLSICLSTSDGLPASFIESMACGEFPIQSNTSMAYEWVEDGKTAFLVNPGDTEDIAKKIIIALKDDMLVDRAAKINQDKIQKYMDSQQIDNNIISTYIDLLNDVPNIDKINTVNGNNHG